MAMGSKDLITLSDLVGLKGFIEMNECRNNKV